MSVILEFTIDPAEFVLGQVLESGSEMSLEIERIVPTGDQTMPFIWATGEDFETFERSMREHPAVREVLALDRVGDSGLYRIEWADAPTDLIEGIAKSEGAVLRARGDGTWVFHLRFPDHDKLTQFHNFLIDHDITVHIERTYTLSEQTERGHRFDLTTGQREALVLALERGYFATPREIGLDELARQLGVSQQAVSERVRRGNEKVLRSVLLSSMTDRY
jgi:predicted DNA binding protein